METSTAWVSIERERGERDRDKDKEREKSFSSSGPLLPVPVDVDSHAEMEEVHRLNATMVRRAIHSGGTCTGEHGIGMGKMEWLLEEHGPHSVRRKRKRDTG